MSRELIPEESTSQYGELIKYVHQHYLQKLRTDIKAGYETKWGKIFNRVHIISNVIEIITSIVLFKYYHNSISFNYILWPLIEILRLFILSILRCFILFGEFTLFLLSSILFFNFIGFLMIVICAPIYLYLLSQNRTNNAYTVFIVVYTLFIVSRIIFTIPVYIRWSKKQFNTHQNINEQIMEVLPEQAMQGRVDGGKISYSSSQYTRDNDEEKPRTQLSPAESLSTKQTQESHRNVWTEEMSATEVAEWLMEQISFKNVFNKTRRESITNEIIQADLTGADVPNITEDDLNIFGIEDDENVGCILAVIEEVKTKNSNESVEISDEVSELSIEIVEQKKEKDENSYHKLKIIEQKEVQETTEQEVKKDKKSIGNKRRKKITIQSKNWDAKKIVQYIVEIKELKQYEQILTDSLRNFNGYNISQLQKKDLKKLGVKKIAHRNQMYDRIQNLDVKSVQRSHIEAPEIDLSKLHSETERKRLEKFHLKLHQKVQLTTKNNENRKGVIRYFGPIYKPSYSSGIYGCYVSAIYRFGIQLIGRNDKAGDHNGTVNNIVYFNLEKQNGIFVFSNEINDKVS